MSCALYCEDCDAAFTIIEFTERGLKVECGCNYGFLNVTGFRDCPDSWMTETSIGSVMVKHL